MGLFKPVWMTDKQAKEARAVSAVSKVDDPGKLAEIACTAPLARVAMAAIEQIGDDETLTRIALPAGARTAEARAAAFAKVRDRARLLSLMDAYRTDYLNRSAGAYRVMGEAVADAYARLDAPPFEWVMTMQSEQAGRDLLAAVYKMRYPADRDRLVRVALEKLGQAAACAVKKLPYEQEREVLRRIAARGEGTDPARAAALSTLRLPDDRDVVDDILASPKSGVALKQRVARLLPPGDPWLGRRVCPHCGAVDSVFHDGGYDSSIDEYYSAYKCCECGNEERQRGGMYPAADFSVPLRK